MRKQRGVFDKLLMYGIAAVAVLGMLYGLYYSIDKAGYNRAKAEWDEANRKEAAKEAERKAGEQKILAEEKEKRKDAEQQAAQADLNWKEAVDAARKADRKLAGVVCPSPRGAAKPPVPSAPGKPGAPPTAPPLLVDGGDVRFTWEFVGLYDSIWTDREGKPVFGNPQGILKGAGQADSAAFAPYGPQEVIEAHGKNAVRCSSIERLYNSLLDTIQRLEKDWDRAMVSAP
jgi:hypothetical protein